MISSRYRGLRRARRRLVGRYMRDGGAGRPLARGTLLESLARAIRGRERPDDGELVLVALALATSVAIAVALAIAT